MNPASTIAFDRIVLMGFMGSGKTTVGRLLAHRLGWTFIDLDSAVEERCGRSVPQIFAESGEEHFRHEESLTLRLVAADRLRVIALGGGAIEHSASQDLLRRLARTAVIYLQAPFAELRERCSTQDQRLAATARPLLRDLARAEARYEAREPVYQDLATLTVSTSSRSPEQVAEAIFQQLS